jgi:hypothetical protein
MDQAHEQNNEVVMGAVGLTENPSAFRKWMVAGPEKARLLKEFEDDYFPQERGSQYGYHKDFVLKKVSNKFDSQVWKPFP